MCDGEYNTGVEIWIINDNGEMLLTQRHPSKSHPYQWECIGGMVLAGETSLEGIRREVFEEIGINIDKTVPKLIGTQIMSNQFVDTYLLNLNINISHLSLQSDEVINAKWVTISELNIMREQREFVNSVLIRFDAVKNKIISHLAK
ncbi:NUDIX domain-containing protein [Clostridium sp. FP2]|uniref:NUDIX hydrolase n=1 Tax=Clostridium sp. FP2 TaxID=2724481 RepID=UPI0013E976C8|nr:NUDIX domain-containing protein [Clostridium sp. FP2]MBZ9623669.1 NUDIX domain-containing protein [Clostridium sp. FP2]